jgi:hypothetical protein
MRPSHSTRFSDDRGRRHNEFRLDPTAWTMGRARPAGDGERPGSVTASDRRRVMARERESTNLSQSPDVGPAGTVSRPRGSGGFLALAEGPRTAEMGSRRDGDSHARPGRWSQIQCVSHTDHVCVAFRLHAAFRVDTLEMRYQSGGAGFQRNLRLPDPWAIDAPSAYITTLKFCGPSQNQRFAICCDASHLFGHRGSDVWGSGGPEIACGLDCGSAADFVVPSSVFSLWLAATLDGTQPGPAAFER